MPESNHAVEEGERMSLDRFQETLEWCTTVIGPFDLVDTDQRFHGRTSVYKLRTSSGFCYLKVHRERATWGPEVHGYEQ